jgi:hypothetical protein
MMKPSEGPGRFSVAGLLFAFSIPVAKLYALCRYAFGSTPPWAAV